MKVGGKDFTYPEFMGDESIETEIRRIRHELMKISGHTSWLRARLESLKKEQERRMKYEKSGGNNRSAIIRNRS